jgi:hypothetical protein
MKRLLRAVIGLREDLDLGSKWWHRFVLVASVIIFMTLWLFSGYVLHQPPQATRGNVNIVTSLTQYTKDHRADSNTVDGFANIQALGGLLSDNSDAIADFPVLLDGGVAFCSFDIAAHIPELTRSANVGVSADKQVTEDQVRALVAKDTTADSYCYFNDPHNQWPTTGKIIKYRFKRTAIAKSIAVPLAESLLICVLLFIIGANAYYRGLVYVIYGKRKPRETAASV